MNKQKKVLITGSSTGIGFACLEYFLSKGWNILAHYYEETEKFNKAINETGVESIKCDFSKEDDLYSFLAKIKTEEINALVNSSGCYDNSYDSNDRIKSAKNIFQINTIAPIMIAEVIMNKMKKLNYGRIVSLSSIGVKFGSNMENIFYGSSKIGIESATRSLSREGSNYNILVNAIRPGITDTEFYKRTGKGLTERVKLIPLKRAAEPIEMANFIYYLCSDENTYITGQILPITGGE